MNQQSVMTKMVLLRNLFEGTGEDTKNLRIFGLAA
jgi:hypothetical protein